MGLKVSAYWLSFALLVLAGVVGFVFFTNKQLPARAVVGSGMGMCADSATNLATLESIRQQLVQTDDPQTIRRLMEEFYRLRTHTRADIEEAKRKKRVEKDRERVLGKIAALQNNPAAAAYQDELSSLAEQVREAKGEELAEIESRVDFIDTTVRLQGVVSTVSPATTPSFGGETTQPDAAGEGGSGVAPTPTGWVPNIRDELPQPLRTIVVRTSGELQAALATAKPGDEIVLKEGSYQGEFSVSAQGTAAQPIVIRAEKVLGTRISGNLRFSHQTRNIWVWGVDFKYARVEVKGEGHVFRRVRIWPVPEREGLVLSEGKNARIDYCELHLNTNEEARQYLGRLWNDNTSEGAIRSAFSRKEESFTNVTIERCLLTGGASGRPYHAPNSQFIEAQGPWGPGPNGALLRNTFQINWVLRSLYGNVPRDRTIIDFKQAGMHLLDSHIISAGGAIQLRHGCCFSVRNTRLDNTYISINTIHNLIENVAAKYFEVGVGQVPWDEKVDASKGTRQQPYDTIFRNTRGAIIVGKRWGEPGERYPALNTVIEGHEGPITREFEEGTVIRPTSSVPKKEPPVLSADQVGPFAPWVGITP